MWMQNTSIEGCKYPQLLFYNPKHLKPTSFGFVYLKKFATLLQLRLHIYNLIVHRLLKKKKKTVFVCEEKKRVEGKREREEYFLLGNLYYFIELYVKIRSRIFGEL